MASKDVYRAYGFPVKAADGRHPWDVTEKLDSELSPARIATAGDCDFVFLVVNESLKSLEWSGFSSVPPYLATDDPYPGWDWQLTETAGKENLEILAEPAWMFIADWS